MGVDIPQPFNSTVSGPGGGSIPVNATVSGIPSTFHIDVDTLPKISLGIDPLTVNPITIEPVDLGIRIEKIPDIRAHLPANFNVGLSVLGMELFCIRLCGEAQMITEPYVPNPCEHCGRPQTQDEVTPQRPNVAGKG